MIRFDQVRKLAGCAKNTVTRMSKLPGWPADGTPEQQAAFIAANRTQWKPGQAPPATGQPFMPGAYDLRSLKLQAEIRKLEQQIHDDRQKIYDQAWGEAAETIAWVFAPLQEALEGCRLTPEQQTAVNAALDSVRVRWSSRSAS